MNENLSADILVIGSGCAGLLAAIEAARAGVSVILIDKGLIGKSGSTVGAQQIAVFLPGEIEGDSVEVHFNDTMKAGKGLNDPHLVRVMVQEGRKCISNLESMGLIFERKDNGKFNLMEMNGHSYPRSLFHSDITGKMMLDVMRGEAERLGVNMVDDLMITSLLVTNQKIYGAVGMNFARGIPVVLSAKAVIIATGGAGQLYPTTTNTAQTCGDGLALALKAGAVLKDLEFYQYYPVTIISPNSMKGYAVGIAQFGKLYNRQNERFMRKYDPEAMEGATRDSLSFGMYSEIRSGNGSDNGGVFLDVTGLGDDIYDSFTNELKIFNHYGIDLKQERVEVCPAAHYYMGGIKIDESCHTAVEGLFAAGEAVGGVHGANRLGNNSLLDGVVFGAKSGRTAARYAQQAKHCLPDTNLIKKELAKIQFLAGLGVKQHQPLEIKTKLKQLMWDYIGVIRDEDGIQKTLEMLNNLQETLQEDTGISSSRLLFNKQLVDYLEAENLLLIAKAMAISALERKESRGAHIREDFPQSNDQDWLVNTEVKLEGDNIKLMLSTIDE